MKPNPFKCPECGGAAVDVDGDPFQLSAEDLFWPVSMDILVHCAERHAWFEHADFDRGEINDSGAVPPKVVSRVTSPALENE